MYDELTGHIKQAAYFQWEEAGSSNTLRHWYCVEEIACYFERGGLVNEERLMLALRDTAGCDDIVREIAFRLSFCSEENSAEADWYTAERLLRNSEWRRAVTRAAEIFALKKTDPNFLSHVRSDRVRDHYAAD